MKKALFWAAVAVLAGSAQPPSAHAQVVGDAACPYYAVDVAAFATCDGDRAAGPSVTAASVSEVSSSGDRAERRNTSSEDRQEAPRPVSVDRTAQRQTAAVGPSGAN